MTEEPTVLIFEAPLGSDLYAQAVHLRDAVLRAPLGLEVSPEERLDDTQRQHFCAVSFAGDRQVRDKAAPAASQ